MNNSLDWPEGSLWVVLDQGSHMLQQCVLPGMDFVRNLPPMVRMHPFSLRQQRLVAHSDVTGPFERPLGKHHS